MLESNTDRMWFLIGTIFVTAVAVLIGVSQMPGGMDGALNAFSNRISDTEQYNELRVVSIGADSTNPVSNRPQYSDVYSISDSKNSNSDSLKDHNLTSNFISRGLGLFVFNDEDELEFYQRYDVYSSASASQQLANKIKSITDSSKLLLLVASDALSTPTGNTHLQGGLPEALYSIGASPEIYGKVQYREPYVLIGKPGLGQGNGHERTAPRYEIVDFKVSLSEGWSPALRQTSRKNMDKGNLIPSTAGFNTVNGRYWVRNSTSSSFETNAWATQVLNNNWVQNNLKPDTQYKIDYDVTLVDKPTNNVRDQAIAEFNLYRNPSPGAPFGPAVYFGGIGQSQYRRMNEGDTVHVSDYFVTPSDVNSRHILFYTALENEDTGNQVAEMEISNVRLVEVER